MSLIATVTAGPVVWRWGALSASICRGLKKQTVLREKKGKRDGLYGQDNGRKENQCCYHYVTCWIFL